MTKTIQTTRDLGTFDAPVLICGGAYGNLEAVKALESWARSHGIPADHIIHTGDLAAYCADPSQVCAFIQQHGWHAIKGNVEEQLGLGAADCACGFDEGSVCDVMAARWYAHADASLSHEQRQWMHALPPTLSFTLADRRFLVVHGGVDQTNRFMFEGCERTEFDRQFALAASDAVIAGHTGIPFTKLEAGRVWHNSGALGMPANDGTPRVWFSTISPMAGGIRFSHHTLRYDYMRAASKMRACDMPEGYATALETGLWPALDILPPRERQAAGHSLHLADQVWPSAMPVARAS